MLFNTIVHLIEDVRDSHRVKNTSKDSWIAATDAGSDEQYAARQAFLQSDYEFSSKISELCKMLIELADTSCMQTVLNALTDETRSSLRCVLTAVGFDHFLSPQPARTGVEPLATAWRKAGKLFTAARSINERRQLETVALDFDSLASGANSYRDPDAWQKVVSTCELFLDMNKEFYREGEDGIADAIWTAVEHFRKIDDRAMLALQAKLQDLDDHGLLENEMMKLDTQLYQFVHDALSSGLVRKRQREEAKPHYLRELSMAPSPDAIEDLLNTIIHKNG